MKKYNIGLDIGTTSVGWAVVEKENFKVMKKGKKKLWGVRLFESAESALERRNSRSTRRRYDRRRKRIKLLQKEFQNEICKVDSNFYQKLNETFYHESDVSHKTISISKDEKDQIKIYYQKYPTIYHLRNKLVHGKERMDIRLIYLAIHHIIKYRGNFLYEGAKFNTSQIQISEKISSLFQIIDTVSTTIEHNSETLELLDVKKLEKILLLESKNDRRIYIKEILKNYFSKEFVAQFTKLILGDTFSISKLFAVEMDTDIKINFKGSDYEEKYMELEKAIGNQIEILEEMKNLYDMVFLKKLLEGETEGNISAVMVKRYDMHRQDLNLLKSILKSEQEMYQQVFKTKGKPCLYEEYIHNHKTYDEFTKKIQSFLEKIATKNEGNKEYIQLKNRIESGIFLPRVTSTENGKFPYQLNCDELISIIENQGIYYPFLKDKENGEYKLVQLLQFRIPYYVGPLNDTTNSSFKNPNAWVIKKNNVACITPYNFKEVVDLEASAEEFILRMVGKCSYLLKENAMPAHSILYSKFKVLNELKQIRVNGQKLEHDTQQKIYENFFLKTSGTLTDKRFQTFLHQIPEMRMYDELSITGYSADMKFANNMQSYIDFFGESGIFEGTTYGIEDAEQIISWITIFEDKDILRKKVEANYSLSEIKLNSLLKKKYKGWSNLSEKLLTTAYYENQSILDIMEMTEENFMQVLYNKKYKFQDMIAQINGSEMTEKLNYDVVRDLATSPATKKGIYQALLLVEEIVDIIGYEPDQIILEMARGDDKKERKDDKKKYLEHLYENCKQQIDNYSKLKNELNHFEKIDTQKLFLYFIQEGKSLYSGTPLDIEKLESYEIDHIIPRTILKDDSIENKALVLREENQEKSADLILPSHFRNDTMRKWWNRLKDNDLMSAKKYHNLCRSKYSSEDIEGFVNRQLVETRQIAKHVANIIQKYHPESNLVYIPASLSHNYREKFELYKFRDINNFHHAHDAYLAAVLGEYKVSYLNEAIDFDKLKELTTKWIHSKNYKELNYGYAINSLDNHFPRYNEQGEIVFEPEKFNHIVHDTLYQNDIIISKKTEMKTGRFYKETIHSKKEKGNKIPLKAGLDPKLYGGYQDIEVAYTVLVFYHNQYKLVGIPIYIHEQAKKNPKAIIEYIRTHLKLKESDSCIIKKDKIFFNTLLNYKGQNVYLRGYATESQGCEVANATELKISKNKMEQWKHTLNYVLNEKKIPKALEDIYTDSEIELQMDDIIQWLLSKKDYYPLFENAINKIETVLKDANLSFDDKKRVIKELFILYGTDRDANLSFIQNGGLSNRIGRLSGKNINNGTIIYRSISGLKERYYEF